MAHRVLINADGMKITPPGVNVLTAGNSQLSFNTDWSALPFLMRGVTTVPAITSGSSRTWTIAYAGGARSRPPFALFALEREDGKIFSHYRLSQMTITQPNGGAGPPPDNMGRRIISATANAASLSFINAVQGGPLEGYTGCKVYYLVWDYNI